jgi:long-chain acyl-CoA synthetase
MVIGGDKRSCLGALIVPEPEALKAEIKRQRLIVWSKHRAVTHPKIVALYRERIKERLAELSHHEQIGPFRVLDRGFTPETGELTPSLKMRRDVIEKNFAREIDSLFPSANGSAPPPVLTTMLPSLSWLFGNRT